MTSEGGASGACGCGRHAGARVRRMEAPAFGRPLPLLLADMCNMRSVTDGGTCGLTAPSAHNHKEGFLAGLRRRDARSRQQECRIGATAPRPALRFCTTALTASDTNTSWRPTGAGMNLVPLLLAALAGCALAGDG